MSKNNRIMSIAAEAKQWREHLHMYPELGYKEVKTAEFIATKLAQFGVDDLRTGVGGTGVVARIIGSAGSRGESGGSANHSGITSIGLRADMDALPISEQVDASQRPHRSKVEGVMHACGHDGHVATLLAVAQYLAEHRNWSGEVILLFQPAEEGGAGAKAMIDAGVLEQFPCDEVYAIHNMPGLDFGTFASRSGAFMASTDTWDIAINGVGGHAARPNLARDPIVAASVLVSALQTIVARNNDPVRAGVVSVTQVHAGNAYNVIPQTARLAGTSRAFCDKVRGGQLDRIQEIAAGIAKTFDVQVDFKYFEGYPVTVNHCAQTGYALDVAQSLPDCAAVIRDAMPVMGAEDFSYFLEKRPGTMVFVGTGEGYSLHHPRYDFNDEIIPLASEFFVKLVESRLN